ncbi:LLM class flavin-dependent oxidoreductase [Chitinophaga sp. Mgbs1]|uniref:LLM class flavin-dependent oxidoreductase n=1 Tax=Chitinophaga solisilvae TaxID=1233460 RepID=A0A3S1BJ17_9BACT|nr:LLM class flavin-dependent oxidoreductase [Chitinophaga solisilvae]
MQLNLRDRTINVFSVIYRDEAIQSYDASFIADFVQATREHGYSGLLLFEANRSNLDPWITGQHVMMNGMVPFIAINPVYMHPFAAARKIAALSRLYQNRIFINFITGTSDSDLLNLNDRTPHDERYDRLSEYILIMDHLMRSAVPLTFEGKYYQVSNLLLSAKPAPERYPVFFVAGASAGVAKISEKFNVFRASMGKDVAPLQKTTLLPATGNAIHFGIITAPTRTGAVAWMDNWIGETKVSHELFTHAMGNTASRWKKLLEQAPEGNDGVFSLAPLRHLKADCPYYVGSYEEIAEVIVKLVMNGYTTLMLETPDFPDGYQHIARAFSIAEAELDTIYELQQQHQFDFKF